MRGRFLSLLAALALVAACETTPEETGAATGEGGTTATTESAVGETTAAAEPSGPMPGTQEDLVVNVGDRVFFEFDQSDLTAEAQDTLTRQAEWLKQYPSVTITIEGHCDERGTREYNLALGERRANATKNFLVALGVDPNRIATISYGKERPAAIGSNEAAWAQNRRAVTSVN